MSKKSSLHSVTRQEGRETLDPMTLRLLFCFMLQTVEKLWNEHGLTSLRTQYRSYGRRFLQVKRPNQQYQSKGQQRKSKQQNTHMHRHKKGYRQNKHNKSTSLHYNME